jgi:hypothetical protein
LPRWRPQRSSPLSTTTSLLLECARSSGRESCSNRKEKICRLREGEDVAGVLDTLSQAHAQQLVFQGWKNCPRCGGRMPSLPSSSGSYCPCPAGVSSPFRVSRTKEIGVQRRGTGTRQAVENLGRSKQRRWLYHAYYCYITAPACYVQVAKYSYCSSFDSQPLPTLVRFPINTLL